MVHATLAASVGKDQELQGETEGVVENERIAVPRIAIEAFEVAQSRLWALAR